ncbi:Actin-2, muscle-specific [Gryllus bimaculatus]|nr:Actin-2, muscle-specific [Gryllus bimaculatus]
MPLYEGIGLGTEKQPVVIDIGTAYTKHLLVSPKDRRVVIVESLLCPSVFRDTLAKVLFRHFEVSSVLFVPSHLVALCTLGVSTALVLDVGYQEAVLIPVNLRRRLAGPEEEELSPHSRISESTIEDIKVRTCFVTSFERAHKITAGQPDPPPPSVSYQADGSSTVDVPGSARETAYEILFEQDGDEMSVSTMVLDAILKCPVDMRKDLAENILLMGGTTMATGFKARLMSELKYLVTTPKYAKHLAIKVFKVHKPPAKENYVAWLGGSIFGGTDVIVTRSLSKEAYLKENRIPDWANLMYNCREDDNKSANL